MLNVFVFELAKGGFCGVLIHELSSIVSDEKNPGLSWVYTDLFREGVWAKGDAQELIERWGVQIELLKEDVTLSDLIDEEGDD